MNNLYVIGWQLAQPIIVSIITAFITVRLSLRRFRSEKWWEKKVEAYSIIIDAIHHLKDHAEQKLDAEWQELELSPEEEHELQLQYKNAYRELVRTLDVGTFIISDEAVRILEDYKKKPQLNWDEHDFVEIISDDVKQLTECLNGIKQEAKIDLDIKK